MKTDHFKKGDLVSIVERTGPNAEKRRAGTITQFDPDRPEKGIQIICLVESEDTVTSRLGTDGNTYDVDEVIGSLDSCRMIQPAL